MSDELPKVIEGLLERLPSERWWDNDEFEEWFDMFERACRVWYRLPRARHAILRSDAVEGQSRG